MRVNLYFLQENVEHLCSELKNPKYGVYYLCECHLHWTAALVAVTHYFFFKINQSIN